MIDVVCHNKYILLILTAVTIHPSTNTITLRQEFQSGQTSHTFTYVYKHAEKISNRKEG
jgi:hypothetical protein